MSEFIFPKDKELTESVIRKILTENNLGISRLRKLEDYYLGKHDILVKQVKTLMLALLYVVSQNILLIV